MTLHKPRTEAEIERQIAARLENPRNAEEIMRQMAEFSKDISYFGDAVHGTQRKEDEARNSQLKDSLAQVFKATEEAIDAPVAKLRIAELLLILFRTFAEQKEPLRSFVAIDKNLRILMGDSYFGHLPNTMEEHLRARGIETDAKFMSPSEIVEALQIPLDESWIDTVLPTLDMIFEQRYGWPAGTAKNKTPSELCSALEFAVENDDPALQNARDDGNRPSIWYMTKGYR